MRILVAQFVERKMAEPSSALSAYDLILDVALAAKIPYYGSDGQQPAMIPIDQHDLEKCLRCVNRGINMFIASAPPNGWRWMNRIMEVTLGTVQTEGECDSDGDATSLIDSDLADVYDTDDEIVGYYVYDLTKEIYAAVTAYTALTGDITVAAWLDYDGEVSSSTPADGDSYSITDVETVRGDIARYPLDQDFQGEVSGRPTYAKDSNRGHLIDWVHESMIRIKREVAVVTSYPTRAATRPWRKRRWELIVDPSPTAADVLTFPYRIGFDRVDIGTGTANAGSDTTLTDVDLANLYPTDYFKGWYIHLIDGTGKGSYAKVIGYAAATGVFTVADWLSLNGKAGGTDPAAASTASYYVEPADNKHPAGMQFDDAVRAACLAMVEREFDDVSGGYMGEFLERALPRAYEIDARSAPRKLGPMLPGTRSYSYQRIRKDVEYL